MLYQNHPASREYCAMAKRMATEQGSEICGTAMQLMGPEGLLQVLFFF
jgi:alkylation response protein AidB-like acyl-CoA dehydrogenase